MHVQGSHRFEYITKARPVALTTMCGEGLTVWLAGDCLTYLRGNLTDQLFILEESVTFGGSVIWVMRRSPG